MLQWWIIFAPGVFMGLCRVMLTILPWIKRWGSIIKGEGLFLAWCIIFCVGGRQLERGISCVWPSVVHLYLLSRLFVAREWLWWSLFPPFSFCIFKVYIWRIFSPWNIESLMLIVICIEKSLYYCYFPFLLVNSYCSFYVCWIMS